MQALQLDAQRKDFLYLGYPLHLTPAEFEIVQILVANGRYTAGGNAVSVSVHVCAINKKAQRIGGRRLIHTVRGRGYRLCDDI
ncbi:MAG: winged helix-turn-helix transcriptional regulator [Clostridia bacterium]|nr:winged helix-turn-helix transcriptional regulator [Clostridia bacterium]